MSVFSRLILVLLVNSVLVQNVIAEELWSDVLQIVAKNSNTVPTQKFNKARLLTLDTNQMQLFLNTSAPSSALSRSASSRKQITLPLPDGRQISVEYKNSVILPELLAKKFPEIKTFKLIPDENIFSGTIDITPNGFHAMLQMHDGEVIFIDPTYTDTRYVDVTGHSNQYASYRKQDQSIDHNINHNAPGHQCLLDDHSSDAFNKLSPSIAPLSKMQSREDQRSVQHLLRYRIAIAATGEYTALKGGKSRALSAIATTLNRVNQVYEQDLGIHLSLVENNDEIIFEDKDSDPYTSTNTSSLITINQGVINRIIGVQNYDLGHLFSTSGGGLAVIGSACNDNSKAKGMSGTSNPGSDSFSLDFVAHEIGHQLGATHTFNSSEGLCAGRTRSASTAFEPGSGSTIMSYAGICGSDNIQSHVDAMFHIGSIEQIRNFTQNGNGSRCGIRATLNNEPPRPNAGSNYVIPANTPFELKGHANDPEGDRLVYAWEQVDVGTSSAESEDTGNNALFRAHLPNRSSSRTFPPLENLLYHQTTRGENLPIRDRTLRFKLVAQDGFNAAQSDEMSISVKRTGSRFALNMPRSHYNLGRDYKISWNTANTEQAPIYCDSVDVLLSTNGGYDFDYTLAEGVPNTGNTWVTLSTGLPETSEARFKVSCSNNIFFAISYKDFSLVDDDDIEDAQEQGAEPSLNDRSPQVSQQSNLAAAGGSFNLLGLLMVLLMMFLMKTISRLFVNPKS